MTVQTSEDDDFYRILGVTRDVGEEGLKQAYRRQALRWHPDKNQHQCAQAAEQFKKVSEAYQTLSDKQSRAVYNRRRPSAGSDEVLFSKTYGWPGVNISFYWTGPSPKHSDVQPSAPKKAPTKATRVDLDAKSRPADSPKESTIKSPLEFFTDMFDMDSPLAAFDKRPDGVRRQGSFMESVFGSFQSFDSTQEEPKVATPTNQADQTSEDRRYASQANCMNSKAAKEKRRAVIEEEYQRGDLNEDEYKELIGLFSVP
jgi:curved DNA-binding protein CbpA